MDKVILKKFAVESRQGLMDKVRGKIKLFYVDEDFNSEQKGDIYILSNENHTLSLTNEEFRKRELLIKRIKELSMEQVIEEAAYTWFNRIIAIRYMEINDMLPVTKDNQSLGIRVLSSKDNTPDPEILRFTNLVNPELDIDFKKEKYAELKDDNEKFKYVLLLVCRKLGKVIPQVFDGVTDYIDILIPDNLLNDTGFITKVINEVPEDNYNQVEIIGWLYQYYNQTEKDRVISTKKAYKKNEIPYATQLFTPDWIVKYMVENSLGRYWIEHKGNKELIKNWKYFVNDDELEYVDEIDPKTITCIDPCMGSGHVLVYMFEVLYQIYQSYGYSKNNIAELILENNIYGIDIDDRAGQLSILSILLKARAYDKMLFNKPIVRNLNVMSIQESNFENILDYISFNEEEMNNLTILNKLYSKAKELGSLITGEKIDCESIKKHIKNDHSVFEIELNKRINPVIKQNEILANKYDVVVTNPPYMNNIVMNDIIRKYMQSNYKNVKTDLFSAFIMRNTIFAKKSGYVGFLTPNVWLFISSYENLRNYICENTTISSLIQLGKGAFFSEATVDLVSFVLKNKYINKKGIYFRLFDVKGDMNIQEKKFKEYNEKRKYYKVSTEKFKAIPGNIIGYWVDDNISLAFSKGKLLGEISAPRQGLATTKNELFIRNWYEININDFYNDCENAASSEKSNLKWYPYNKGGLYRKWYGNAEYVINWQKNGRDIKEYIKNKNPNVARGEKFYFKESISWSKISSGKVAFRYFPKGFIFDVAGCSIFIDNKNLFNYIFAFLNSNTSEEILKCISPTLNYEAGQIQILPLIIDNNFDQIGDIVENNISLAKDDWDSFETSWDFSIHPLIEYKTGAGYEKNITKWNYLIKNSFDSWKINCDKKFELLKQNEEELNRIFIDIYGLQEELTPEIEDKDITIRLADKERDIKSLISYAVGCMFGRYSLDKDGLIYAGGDFDNVYKKYKKTDGGWAGSGLSNYKYLNNNGNEIELSFEVDNDNIIPITDEAYFSDDIVERFKTFLKTVYGDNTFNENIDFIAEVLGKKGTETSEETIRRYFVNDFFNDHCKIYQKRPIYWLLDSGKKNGFKALIYMHRYNENLIPKARLDYLHRVQTTYEKLLSDVNYKLTTELSMTDKKEAKNRQTDLIAKLQEIKEYDEKIAHIANQRINIDLDDGVKVNYEKFKEILAKIK